MDDYKAHQMSTYALTLFRYKTKVHDKEVAVGMAIFGFCIHLLSIIHYPLFILIPFLYSLFFNEMIIFAHSTRYFTFSLWIERFLGHGRPRQIRIFTSFLLSSSKLCNIVSWLTHITIFPRLSGSYKYSHILKGSLIQSGK